VSDDWYQSDAGVWHSLHIDFQPLEFDEADMESWPPLVELRSEVARLNRWKAEACQVIDGWERVHEALGSPGGLGESRFVASEREALRLRAAEVATVTPVGAASREIVTLGCGPIILVSLIIWAGIIFGVLEVVR
jgi:hypothetical protein